MFNETTYLGEIAACKTIKNRCLELWPGDDADISNPANVGLNKCLTDAGYWRPGGTTKCFESRVYDKPDATTYPIDVITNPSNPNTVWQFPDLNNLDLKSLGIGATTGLLIASALVLFLLLKR